MNLRLLHLFLVADSGPVGAPEEPRPREYVVRVREAFAPTGPDAARFPGLVWPLTTHMLESPRWDIRPLMDTAIANCREYGGDWETGVMLMFRTHMVVDSPGNLSGVDDDLAELRAIGLRVGDRWMRAQISSAAGEAAMARGRTEEARGEYEDALRLAHEVGAHAESPFLVARLAEIAYRTGDRAGALAALDEATAAADRFGVPDSRAFINLLRLHMALEDGDPARARELWETSRTDMGRGSPPPQFIAMLDAADGLITNEESGPVEALPKMLAALRTAVDHGCGEVITGALADGAATVLSSYGDHPRAIRLLAAGAHWRGSHPRPVPERDVVRAVEDAARTELGAVRYEAERAAGSGFTPEDALTDLTEAVRALPSP
jgi:tetratricopeptide (TPR) repeat protein